MTTSQPPARRFDGKTALVTGAAGGIGSAISRRLAGEGARVFISDVNEAAAKEVADALVDEGRSAELLVFDLVDPAAPAAAVRQIMDVHGRLDVLVNNAGINRRGDLLSLTEDDWDLSFAANVDSLFHLCRAVLPHMIEAGGGAIVNTASQWGLYPAPGHMARLRHTGCLEAGRARPGPAPPGQYRP